MSKIEPNRGRILIVEDVKEIADLMQLLLTNRGYQVETAGDGEQCLERASSSSRPGLILLDLMIPKIHGMEVLRLLKADPKTAGIGVIVCTAKQYKPDQDQAMELGAFQVLTKPFVNEELLELVSRFFAGSARTGQTAAPRNTETGYVPAVPRDRRYCHFWGTRGSIPVSGHGFMRHGGNTSCVEVGCGDESVIVDAGSGIRDLGLSLLKKGPRRLHLLITHTHWDHIQGFPFFAPVYVPGFELIVYGATAFKKNLKAVLTGQLDRDYFPVQFEDMRSKIEFRKLEPEMQIAGFKITWEYTHHPAATVGYKFERDGKSLAIVSDNEFLYGYLGSPREIPLDRGPLVFHRKLVDFVTGTDHLVAEAQYLNEDYPGKIGWGHSALTNACALASLAKVRRWTVTHHDPGYDDEVLGRKLNLTREVLRDLDCPIEVVHAYDGLTEYW